MKLADVLWKAANMHLSADDGGVDPGYWPEQSPFTCDSARWAAPRDSREAVNAFLFCLGLPKSTEGKNNLFDDFQAGLERQGVRYMWLLLAMHVAEDEGIEV